MVCYPGPVDPSVAEHKMGENPHVTDWTQMPTDAQRNHIKSLLSRDKAECAGHIPNKCDIHKLRHVHKRETPSTCPSC